MPGFLYAIPPYTICVYKELEDILQYLIFAPPLPTNRTRADTERERGMYVRVGDETGTKKETRIFFDKTASFFRFVLLFALCLWSGKNIIIFGVFFVFQGEHKIFANPLHVYTPGNIFTRTDQTVFIFTFVRSS